MSRVFVEDYIGYPFGRLVIEDIVRDERRPKAFCRCSCGNVGWFWAENVIAEKTRSCGCLRDEQAGKASITHGETTGYKASKEYLAWANMVRRCHDPANKAFKYYGDRGISVCDEWKGSFTAFLRDMGRAPSAAHTVERVRNGEGYKPGNCIWATNATQAKNKSNNRRIALDGCEMILADWARLVGLQPTNLRRWLAKHGEQDGLRRVLAKYGRQVPAS